MATTRHVALLRGINVGGKRPVPMAPLRAALAEAGFEDVATLLQSGNVLLSASGTTADVEARVEAVLLDAFGLEVPVVVRTGRQVRAVVADAPAGFGTQPDVHHSDVVFLKAPLTAAAAMRVVELRDGVDAAWPGRGVVYFQRVSARRTQSRMSRFISTPEYQLMTIRSWSTTTKLVDLLG